jgi:hypothetical protein
MAVAGRDQLKRLVQRVAGLAQGGQPVPPLVFGELVRSCDAGDGIGEREDAGLGHWDGHLADGDGQGLIQVYLRSNWENVKSKFR